jgi:hypothetical protein
MSPTVPPISEMTTSAGETCSARWILALISFVMCGREVLVDEALVMADVEIGLGPVLGDEDLAVLERAHRARIDVQIRVELLGRDGEAARFEEAAERGGHDALPQRGDDTTRDEHVPGHGFSP